MKFLVFFSGEVEEQIALLENLVPDWIYRKLTPGGDIMYKWVSIFLFYKMFL